MPRHSTPSVTLLLVSLALSGCGGGPPGAAQPLGPEDARSRFASFWEAYGEDMTSGEAAAVAAWFTDDAELMEPGRETFRGRDEIRRYLDDALEQFRVTEVGISPEEVHVHGAMAYEMGTAREVVEVRGGDGATTTWQVRYAAVWMRGSDGRWRIHRLLVSPLAGPSP